MPVLGESARTKALKNLSMAVADPTAAKRIKSAQDIKTRQQAAAVPMAPGASSRQIASAVGQQATAGKAQADVEMQKQQQSQQTQIGQLGLAETGRQQRAFAGQKEMSQIQERSEAEQALSSLSLDTKRQLFDMRQQFEKDELGRTRFNQRQLADYAIMKAESEEDFKNYAQYAQQMAQREIQTMEAAYNKIKQALEQDYRKDKQQLDFEAQKKLAEYKNALEKEIQRKKAEAANKSAMWSAAGTVLGAAAGVAAAPFTGGVVNPATGAMIGANIGGGLGSLAYSSTQ